jgi:acetyl-CoA carboxylase carboxyltransferase component
MTVDPIAMFATVTAGLGVLGAGVGIYRFGASRGELQSRTSAAMDLFMSTQGRIADAMERTAQAAEQNAKWIPLIEAMHEDRHELGLTLRAMSRKLNALMRTNQDEDATDHQGS